jgi:hypothetical protein
MQPLDPEEYMELMDIFGEDLCASPHVSVMTHKYNSITAVAAWRMLVVCLALHVAL